MACEKLKELLAAEVFGDNSPVDRKSIANHIASCADCRRQTAQWREVVAQIQAPTLPQDDAFWAQQKVSIMAQLPSRSSSWSPHRWAMPAMAMGIFLSVWGVHRQTVRTDMRIAQQMDLLQNMDMLQQIDVIENLDVLENK